MIHLRPGALAVAGLLLCSCGSSQKTNFYTLAAADETTPAVRGPVKPVTVGQVTIPRIVDKPQLIRRVSADQITLFDFDRWASPLDDNTRRVFTIDLDHALPPGSVIRSDGSPYDTSIGVIDLEIDRFDSDPAGTLTFDVSWSLTRGNPQQTIERRSEHITESASGQGAAPIADAMSRAVNDLAQKVAAQLPAR